MLNTKHNLHSNRSKVPEATTLITTWEVGSTWTTSTSLHTHWCIKFSALKEFCTLHLIVSHQWHLPLTQRGHRQEWVIALAVMNFKEKFLSPCRWAATAQLQWPWEAPINQKIFSSILCKSCYNAWAANSGIEDKSFYLNPLYKEDITLVIPPHS